MQHETNMRKEGDCMYIMHIKIHQVEGRLGPVWVPGLLVGLQPKSCHFKAEAKPMASVIRAESKVCLVALCSASASCDGPGFPLCMFGTFQIFTKPYLCVYIIYSIVPSLSFPLKYNLALPLANKDLWSPKMLKTS